MKKLFALALLLVFGIISLSAQFNSTISGQVISADSKQVVPAATVILLTENDTLVAGDFTSEDGSFIIECKAKRTYIIELACSGYSIYRTKEFVGELNRDYNLGKIELLTMPGESGITGNNQPNIGFESRLDKKTLFPSTTITQPGASVFDAFKLFDEISYNEDGKLSIRGSDKVIILLNGTQSEYTTGAYKYKFKEMQASEVQRIELIRNPSQESFPESISGIVNIVFFQEDIDEFSGSAGFVYSMSVLNQARADLPSQSGSYSQFSGYSPFLNISRTTNRLSLNINAGGVIGKNLPNNEFITRNYDDGRTLISQVPQNRLSTHYGFDGNAVYRINEKNSLNLSSIYSRDINDDLASIPYFIESNYSRYRYIRWGLNERKENSLYSLNYMHYFDRQGESLSAGFSYSNNWISEVYSISDSSRFRNTAKDKTEYSGTEQIANLSIDYSRPWRSGRIEIGTKIKSRTIPVRYYQDRGENSSLYPGLGNMSKLGESAFGAYFNLIHEKRWYDIRLSVKPEYTSVANEIDDANIYYSTDDYAYFRFYPNAIARLKISPNNIFSAKYSQRVDKPGMRELRCFADSYDYELVNIGNPYLQPQFTNEYELRYQAEWKSGAVGLSAYLWSIRDMYTQVYTMDEANNDYDVILKTFANVKTAIDRGLVFDFKQEFFRFWAISANARYYQIRYSDHTGTLLFPYEHEYHIPGAVGNSWDAQITNTFSISDNFEIRLSGLYYSPRIIPQGKELEGSSIDLGLMIKLFKGKGEFRIDASDLLIQNGLTQEISGSGFNIRYENYYPTQMIKAGFKYLF